LKVRLPQMGRSYLRRGHGLAPHSLVGSPGLGAVRSLYWAAVINGLLAAPLMAVMMLLVHNPRVVGRLTVSRSMALWGWGATGVMAAASLAFFVLP
jgi:Mn2+/Fe2+ NRAMP family transporter